jgi:hypothetical protein
LSLDYDHQQVSQLNSFETRCWEEEEKNRCRFLHLCLHIDMYLQRTTQWLWDQDQKYKWRLWPWSFRYHFDTKIVCVSLRQSCPSFAHIFSPHFLCTELSSPMME